MINSLLFNLFWDKAKVRETSRITQQATSHITEKNTIKTTGNSTTYYTQVASGFRYTSGLTSIPLYKGTYRPTYFNTFKYTKQSTNSSNGFLKYTDVPTISQTSKDTFISTFAGYTYANTSVSTTNYTSAPTVYYTSFETSYISSYGTTYPTDIETSFLTNL